MIDNEIITAIAVKINEQFPDARIFDGQVPQDLKSGDFSIFLENVSQTSQLFGFILHSVTYSVYCFGAPLEAETDKGKPNGNSVDLTLVQQKLLPQLEILTLLDGSKIRRGELTAEIENDILKITVGFAYRIKPTEDTEIMKELIRR